MKNLNFYMDIARNFEDCKQVEIFRKNIIELITFFHIFFWDILTRLNLLVEEIIHIQEIFNYFCVENNLNFSPKTLRGAFCNLNKLFNKDQRSKNGLINDNLRNIEYNLRKVNKIFTVLINKVCSKDISYFKGKSIFYDLKELFTYYFEIGFSSQNLIKILNFIQKKVNSLLNAFPGYYPSPQVSSIREYLKTHYFIESYVENILKVTTSLNYHRELQNNFNIYFFWDFEESVEFYEDMENNMILNSDPYFPSKQFYWILLFHEVLHYLTDFVNEKLVTGKSKELNFIEKNLLDFYKELKALPSDIASLIILSFQEEAKDFIDTSIFLDIAIDSILTYMFGLSYFLPSLLNLIFYDEKSLYQKSSNFWILRTLVPMYFLTLKRYPHYKLNNYIINAYKLFVAYYMNIKLSMFPKLEEKSYKLIISIASLITSEIENFLRKKEKLINYLEKEFKKSDLINSYLENQNDILNFLGKFIDDKKQMIDNGNIIDTSIPEVKEGRKLCSLLNFLSLDKHIIRKDSFKDKINQKNIRTFSICYYKIRCDKDKEKNFFKFFFSDQELNNFNFFVNFGPFSALFIKSNDSPKLSDLPKFREGFNLESLSLKIDNVLGTGNNNFKSRKSFSETLKCKGYKYFKRKHYLNVLDKNILEDFFKNLKKFNMDENFLKYYIDDITKIKNSNIDILILIKYQLSLPNQSTGKNVLESFLWKFDNFIKIFLDSKIYVDHHIENILREFNYMHTISYEWFDICTFIGLELKNSNLINPILDKILEKIKEIFIQKLSEEKFLFNIIKTETDIFLSPKFIKTNIPCYLPIIQLKVSSKYIKNKGYDRNLEKHIFNTLEKFNLKEKYTVKKLFGIRDFILIPKKNKEINFIKNLFNLIASLGELELTEEDNKPFSDIQIIPSVLSKI